jgi:hypothetical protein
VRETQLQVRDRLTVQCAVYSVFSRSPEWRKAEPPDCIHGVALKCVGALQGVSSVGTGNAGAVLGRLRVHGEATTGQDDT